MSLMFGRGKKTPAVRLVEQGLNIASTGEPFVPPDTPRSDPTAEIPITQSDVLKDFPIVSNPAMDRNAFDSNQFPYTSRALQGFMAGHRIRVIYYNLLTGQNDVRTDVADSPNERSIIHTRYLKISDMEITLKEPMDFSYDRDKSQGNYVGTARLYAGLTPRYGDVFLFNIGDNKIGEFRITSIDSSSLYNNRTYSIGFYLYNYPDQGDLDFLESAVARRCVFDPETFLSGSYALLSEDKFLQLQKLRSIRDILSRYYFRTFYSQDMGTFIQPQTNRFDPYLSKFMSTKCTYDVVKQRPRQLIGFVDDTYDHTIWARLSECHNPTFADVWGQCIFPIYNAFSMDIGVTELLGMPYVSVVEPFSDPVKFNEATSYALSEAFYRNDLRNMSPLEAMIADVISRRRMTDPGIFISQFLSQYQKLSKMDQFYAIPLYIALIDVAIPSLERILPD